MSAPQPRTVLFVTREAWSAESASARRLFEALRADGVAAELRHVDEGLNVGDADLGIVVSRGVRWDSLDITPRDVIVVLDDDVADYPAEFIQVSVYRYPKELDALLARIRATLGPYSFTQSTSERSYTDDTGFLGAPLESVRGVTRSAPVEQVYLNVWFPKFEPRAPRFVVDVPIEMRVALGPQRHGAPTEPLSEYLLDRLRRLSQIDVWVQCADADVTPCDGTLHLPWPTNVLSFDLTPRRPGGLRIVVGLLIHNQPVHRLEHEVQVHDRRDRSERWG